MFHPDPAVAERRDDPINARVFKGDGTPYLRVPGLVALEKVVIGNMTIPFSEARAYPIDVSLQRHQTVQEPLIHVTRDNDGTPVIMRSLVSNDGLWQKDANVTVIGCWTD